MTDSNQSELYDSYIKVLGEIDPLTPDAQGTTGARDYKYLKLSTLLTEIKPVFSRHHLGFYQSVDFELNAPEPWRIYNQPLNAKGRYSKDPPATIEQPIMISVVNTYIFNASKSEQQNRIKVGSYPVVMTGDPKANGSAVTYARRYSLFAALGIYPDPDDDGTAAQTQYVPQQQPQTTSEWQQAQRAAQAQHNPPQQQRNKPQSHPQAQTQPQQSNPAPPMQSDSRTGITKDEADALWQLCKSVGVDLYTTASQIKGHKVTKLRELTKEDAQLVRARIDQALGTHYASA